MTLKTYLFFIGSLLLISCNKDEENLLPFNENEVNSGGDYTSFDFGVNAFGQQGQTVSNQEALDFFVGNSLFNKNWVQAPASTTARDGLGPFFNQRSCSGCHFKDGRGTPVARGGEMSSGLLLRLSIPGTGVHGGPVPDPIYGGQLQDQAVLSIDKQGEFDIVYGTINGTYNDGTPYALRSPIYTISGLQYGNLSSNILISPRVGQQMYGLGLLEAITDETIIGASDVDDSNNDGISGKPNYVWDVKNNTTALGRFGWKANQPSLEQQVAGAFLGDMGITSYLFQDENCPLGVDCNSLPNGGEEEIEKDDLGTVVTYCQTLAVPARRNIDNAAVIKGKALFNQLGCNQCHTPEQKTGNIHPITSLNNQTIYPYTDLLLHDMGEALSDHRPDFEATGNEWRTPPLWGIGLVETVNGHLFLMHDGRARGFAEAILWHGGEAAKSQADFKALNSDERSYLISFLESL